MTVGWVFGALGAAALAVVGVAAAGASPQGRRPRGPWAPSEDDLRLPRDWGWADVPEDQRPEGWDRGR